MGRMISYRVCRRYYGLVVQMMCDEAPVRKDRWYQAWKKIDSRKDVPAAVEAFRQGIRDHEEKIHAAHAG